MRAAITGVLIFAVLSVALGDLSPQAFVALRDLLAEAFVTLGDFLAKLDHLLPQLGVALGDLLPQAFVSVNLEPFAFSQCLLKRQSQVDNCGCDPVIGDEVVRRFRPDGLRDLTDGDCRLEVADAALDQRLPQPGLVDRSHVSSLCGQEYPSEAMPTPITADDLQRRLSGGAPIALIDVRDPPEYNASHIVGASLIPRRMLEFELGAAVPHRGTPIVLCDEDERRVHLAAATAERMGYTDVSALSGGTNRWAFLDLPTEWGVNVPSKDFGERVEVVHHVPEIDADDLHARIERGDPLVILDTRTPEEYRRSCIPGGRSIPGGELAWRITDVLADAPEDATIVINCAGRTRSIIGTRVLQRMSLEREVVGLKNGTAGWMLAGHELEFGADRDALPSVTGEGQAAAESYARRCAEQDGVQLIGIAQLDELRERSRSESVYFIDVRTDAEHAAGHIPGFRWFPGGQAVQRSDDVAVVHHAPIVFACDGFARAALTASWYRQMGHRRIYALEGGAGAWTSAGRALSKELESSQPPILSEARQSVEQIAPSALFEQPDAVLLHVGTSQQFAEAHPPGARWAPRGWLERDIDELSPDPSTPILVICATGEQSLLAAQTLLEHGRADVSAVAGGMTAYQEAGLPIEYGLSGVRSTPNDVLTFGPQRGFADMQHYLRWETALGEKYASD